MPDAYLTIDDSPSAVTIELVTNLQDMNVPAMFFCRGDRLQENPELMSFAVEAGYVLGNHAFSHQRASLMSLEDIIKEIEHTERLIEQIYARAGLVQRGKYFRFPHMDRGCGGWVVNYDKLGKSHKDVLIKLFGDGLNISLDPPSEEQEDKKNKLQEYLKEQGYAQPFKGVNHDWFINTEMHSARDCMFTYSSSDWMITRRHAGKWDYKSVNDLKNKIDQDEYLHDNSTNHIILVHDQEELLDVVLDLVTYFRHKGINFMDIT
jgi:peptidoglycan/xylan/chitin deacetylase (PgdA/CDA1 family)